MAVRGCDPNSTEHEPAIERVTSRLDEADLTTKKFIPLRPGTKEPCYPHSNSAFHQLSVDITGDYGVYAGDGLVLLDFDDYKDDSKVSDALNRLPSTFTVKTPHGGTHRYYRCKPDIHSRLEQTFGSKNPGISCGEVRVHNQYVVGPGSVLTECSKSGHDCSQNGEGQYRITSDEAIVRLDTNQLLKALKTDSKLQNRQQTNRRPHSPTGKAIEDRNIDDDLEACLEVDPRLQELWTWACGHRPPRTVGFRDDRSKAEVALAAKLWYWLADRDAVFAALEKANPEKWAIKGAAYRNSVVENGNNGDYCDSIPKSTHGGGGGILQETLATIIDALIHSDGQARTEDIVEWDTVRVGKRQVQNGLSELKKRGYIDDERRGRYSYWIADTNELLSFYTDEREYFDGLTTAEEWATQQANYLDNTSNI